MLHFIPILFLASLIALTILSGYRLKYIDGVSACPFKVVSNFKKTRSTTALIYTGSVFLMLFVPFIYFFILASFFILPATTAIILIFAINDKKADGVLEVIEGKIIKAQSYLADAGIFRTI